jgi:hypothetical protein
MTEYSSNKLSSSSVLISFLGFKKIFTVKVNPNFNTMYP